MFMSSHKVQLLSKSRMVAESVVAVVEALELRALLSGTGDTDPSFHVPDVVLGDRSHGSVIYIPTDAAVAPDGSIFVVGGSTVDANNEIDKNIEFVIKFAPNGSIDRSFSDQ